MGTYQILIRIEVHNKVPCKFCGRKPQAAWVQHLDETTLPVSEIQCNESILRNNPLYLPSDQFILKK